MSVSPSPRTGIARLLAASTIGTTIEFYDFFLYATAAATVFNKVFFPTTDPLTGVLLAVVTYALGFAARPIGGVVFGHLGDRQGRKRALVLSLLLMGGSTFAIGLLPTYASVGVLAPLLLVTLRLVQGFSLGGEWGGAVLLVAESGSRERRGFWAAWPQTGGPLGNLLSTGVLAVLSITMSEAQFINWGWRLPFLLSAVLIVIGLWVRTTVEESPLFLEARASAEAAHTAAPIRRVLIGNWRNVLITTFARAGENAIFYTFATFLVIYVTTHLQQPRSLALNALTIASVVQTAGILASGALSDRIGRRPVAIAGALSAGVWSFVFFALVEQKTFAAVLLAVSVGLLLHAMVVGAQAAFFSELFGTNVRYSGASIGYQLGSVLGGSLAPIIGVWLLKTYGSGTPVAIYLVAMTLLTVTAMLLAPETRARDLRTVDTSSPR
ncbi:MFS transporter [Microtetraspora glauca]|uniref:MFS transporter n=1 Tax=Microtetraspora glauca TaxID=1996 RepID=A0ABV3GPL4_MICGL